MRPSGVRAAIRTRIEAITVDSSNAGKRDVFRFVETRGDDDIRLPERAFTVVLAAQPAQYAAYSEDIKEGEWMVTVHYAGSPAVEDRIASDASRIVSRLYRLHEDEADVYVVQASPAGVVEDGPHIRSQFSVVVRFAEDIAVANNTA